MVSFEYKEFEGSSIEDARKKMLMFVNKINARVINVIEHDDTCFKSIGIYFYKEDI